MPLKIRDLGKNNTIEGDTSIYSGEVLLRGNNNHLKLARSCEAGILKIDMHNDGSEIDISNVYRFSNIRVYTKNYGSLNIGEHTSIEAAYFLADGAPISLGRDCMISFGVSLRTTDAHGIYDLETGNLLNRPSAVRLSDHVWLGQDVIVGKGSVIGKGSIVGARSFLGNKEYPSHSIIGGVPAKVLRENVIWDRKMTDCIYSDDALIDHYFSAHKKDFLK